MIVLDASAFLAYLFREPGGEQVGPLLAEAYMTSLNFSEVIGRFVRDGFSDREVSAPLAQSLIILPFSLQHAILAARLIPQTQPQGLSLADRACLALASEMRLPVWTADKAWLHLQLGLDIRSIR